MKVIYDSGSRRLLYEVDTMQHKKVAPRYSSLDQKCKRFESEKRDTNCNHETDVPLKASLTIKKKRL